MQKKVILGGIAAFVLLVVVGIYHYVNVKAKAVLAEQIAVINASYAEMASAGLMPAVALSYAEITANYWQDDYQISDLAINVAGLGAILDVASIRVKGFKPGTLADKGEVWIDGVQLAQGMRILLPAALADLTKNLSLSTQYRYQYQSDSGQLHLQQVLSLGEQFTFNYAFTLQQMQPLWQFAQNLTAMDAQTQQTFSQSTDYQSQLRDAFAQGQLQQGDIVLSNQGFLQALHSALAATPQTLELSNLKLQLEHYLSQQTTMPAEILDALQVFLADPRYLKVSFQLTESLTFAQLQDGNVMAQWQTPEQLIQLTNLQLTVNP